MHLRVPSCAGPIVVKFCVLLVVVEVRGSWVVVVKVIRWMGTATVIVAASGILIFVVSIAFVVVVLAVVVGRKNRFKKYCFLDPDSSRRAPVLSFRVGLSFSGSQDRKLTKLTTT